VDDPDRAVAVLDGVDDHPHRGQVVDLVELAALLAHLRIDGVEVLRAARDLGLDADLPKLSLQELAGFRDVLLALVALLGDELLDLVVLAGMEALEREVLQLPLDRVNTQTVRQWRVDLERLASLLDLLVLRQGAQRAHVVKAIGELDQDDPHVGGHRHHHLAVVLCLVLVAALERDPGELGHAVDQPGDRLAEQLADLVEARRRVLDRVVEERGAERLGVQPQAGADLCDLYGMGDEVLAGAAALIRVALAGERERVLDRSAVQLVGRFLGVLGDHREQVAEQGAVVRREALRVLVLDELDDSGAIGRSDPGVAARLGCGEPVAVQGELAVRTVGYAAAGIGLELCSLPLVRNRTHSS
jgi:hypothetical protein